MLAHWHGQERRLSTAQHRRFIGVVGDSHAVVCGIVLCNNTTVQSLSLLILNARPESGNRVPADWAIGAVGAVAEAVVLPDEYVEGTASGDANP